MDYVKDQVYATLRLRNKPLTSKDIRELTGFSDTEIRTAIRDLRMDGYKICSGSNGFWIWNGIDDTWRHTKAQIKSRIKALSELYRAMENLPEKGQIEWEI